MTSVTNDGRASRWLEADYDGPTFRGLRLLSKLVGAWLRTWLWDQPDIAAHCRVVIRRRDNQAEVAAFDYNRVQEAHDHVTDIQARLAQMTLFEFTRDVGIAYEKIADAKPADES